MEGNIATMGSSIHSNNSTNRVHSSIRSSPVLSLKLKKTRGGRRISEIESKIIIDYMTIGSIEYDSNIYKWEIYKLESEIMVYRAEIQSYISNIKEFNMYREIFYNKATGPGLKGFDELQYINDTENEVFFWEEEIVRVKGLIKIKEEEMDILKMESLL